MLHGANLVLFAAALLPAAAEPRSISDISPTQIKQALQEVADMKGKEYDCGFAIGLRGLDGFNVSVASGGDTANSTGTTGAPITTNSKFIWGSITKMATGVTIIKLANEGNFDLHDPITPILDPYFEKMGYNTTMEKLFGPDVHKVTIYMLATMSSGIADFDTAKPNETNPSTSTDSFRQYVYDHPDQDWTPLELISVPWVALGKLVCPPGSLDKCDYSSTNFVLLGLIIAAHYDKPWDQVDQGAFRPPEAIAAGLLKDTTWGVHGSSETYTAVHGYDRTCYNGQNSSALPGRDVSAVHGVFGGWTASDIVAPVQDVADLVFGIYGPSSPFSLITPENITMMTNFSRFYGFATFLISDFTGQPTNGPKDYGTIYGHLGATYGWNSVAFFQPTLNISISIATNLETMEQAQPSDAFCIAYNRVLNLLQGKTDAPDCKYISSGYFGICSCPDAKYTCKETVFGKQCMLDYYGNSTLEGCYKECDRE